MVCAWYAYGVYCWSRRYSATACPQAATHAPTTPRISQVRGHRVLEQLYALGRKRAPQRAAELLLARSLVAHAADALPQVEGAAGKMTAPEAAAAVHKLQLQVTTDPPFPPTP